MNCERYADRAALLRSPPRMEVVGAQPKLPFSFLLLLFPWGQHSQARWSRGGELCPATSRHIRIWAARLCRRTGDRQSASLGELWGLPTHLTRRLYAAAVSAAADSEEFMEWRQHGQNLQKQRPVRGRPAEPHEGSADAAHGAGWGAPILPPSRFCRSACRIWERGAPRGRGEDFWGGFELQTSREGPAAGQG